MYSDFFYKLIAKDSFGIINTSGWLVDVTKNPILLFK